MRAGREARPEVLFRAFADRNRLRIMRALRAGEVCVGDLVRILRVPQARVSRHLAYLRRSGLVRARRSGLWVRYSLAPARGPVHAALLGCLRRCFRERLRPGSHAGSGRRPGSIQALPARARA